MFLPGLSLSRYCPSVCPNKGPTGTGGVHPGGARGRVGAHGGRGGPALGPTREPEVSAGENHLQVPCQAPDRSEPPATPPSRSPPPHPQ